MKQIFIIFILLVSGCSGRAPGPLFSLSDGPSVYKGQYVVDLVAGAAWCGDADDCIEEVSGTTYLVTAISPEFAVIRQEGAVSVVPYTPSKDLCLTEFSSATLCSPNWVVYPTAIPNDPDYPQQWGYEYIQAPSAWEVQRDSLGVKVAVVDTGVDCAHPEINCLNQFNAITGGDNAGDEAGHGTHVAGTVCARGNNGVGGSGS